MGIERVEEWVPAFAGTGRRRGDSARVYGLCRWSRYMHLPAIDPAVAAAVMCATAATDAVYVRFTGAIVARRRVAAANWSGLWYLLSSYAVISYTDNWVYVVFAAIGSWIGAFVSLSLQRAAPARRTPGSAVE
jgi:hypothetical protein